VNALCPVDFILISLDAEGFGRCSKCNRLWCLPLIEVAMRCDHQPQPVQGWYQFRGERIEYSYCSWDCKLEIEAIYNGMILDLGVK
jgi:hypothetical protein